VHGVGRSDCLRVEQLAAQQRGQRCGEDGDHGSSRIAHALESQQRAGAGGGQREETQRQLCDDAERPLCANVQLVEIKAGAAFTNNTACADYVS